LREQQKGKTKLVAYFFNSNCSKKYGNPFEYRIHVFLRNSIFRSSPELFSLAYKKYMYSIFNFISNEVSRNTFHSKDIAVEGFDNIIDGPNILVGLNLKECLKCLNKLIKFLN